MFDASSLVKLMVSSISLAATPQIRDPYDAIALLSHACMLAVGFRLVGLGEDHKIGMVIHSMLRRPAKLISNRRDL